MWGGGEVGMCLGGYAGKLVSDHVCWWEVFMLGGGLVMCIGDGWWICGEVGMWGGGYVGKWGGGFIVLCVSVISIPVQPAVFQTWSLSDSWSSFHTSLQTGKGNLSHH